MERDLSQRTLHRRSRQKRAKTNLGFKARSLLGMGHLGRSVGFLGSLVCKGTIGKVRYLGMDGKSDVAHRVLPFKRRENDTIL